MLKILSEQQAIDPVRIDMRRQSALADYYLVAGANSTPHLKSISSALRLLLKEEGIICHIADTDAESGWIVLDYLDVVVHLLLAEQRAYYALEDLWREAEPIILKKRKPADPQDTQASPAPARVKSTPSGTPGHRRRPAPKA